MTQPLYHFSEDPTIGRFEPRPPLATPGSEPLVWALDAAHAWTYLFPRDCPRVLLWATERTSAEDCVRWLHGDARAKVACIEWTWFERLQRTALFRYTLPPQRFAPLEGEANAWMLVSRDSVRPLAVEPVGSLIAALVGARVELRLMPSLTPLRNAWATSLHVSGIRLRNARGWDSP